MDTPGTYSYSSEAYWRNGGYGAMMSAPHGTLSLTAAGRLTFTLDSGKILFSAPVVLMKRKNEPMYGWMRFVVGPRLYTLQFYENNLSASMAGEGAGASVAASMRDAQKGRPIFSEWASRLDQAQTLPADGGQLIAAVPTASILRAREYGNKTLRQSQLTMLAVPTVAVVIGVVAGLMGLADKNSTHVFVVLVATAASFLLFILFRRFNRRRQTVDALPHAPQDVSVQPADILAPGTQPSSGFGMTTGKQVLLGFALVPAAFIVVFLLAVIIIAIVTALRG